MAVLIDANVIISFLIRSEKTEEAKRLLERVEEPVLEDCRGNMRGSGAFPEYFSIFFR